MSQARRPHAVEPRSQVDRIQTLMFRFQEEFALEVRHLKLGATVREEY